MLAKGEEATRNGETLRGWDTRLLRPWDASIPRLRCQSGFTRLVFGDFKRRLKWPVCPS